MSPSSLSCICRTSRYLLLARSLFCAQAHFANGEPVPSKFGMPNYNPAMDPAYRHQQQMSYGFGRSPPMYASSPPPGSARPMDVTGYNHIQRTSHMGHG